MYTCLVFGFIFTIYFMFTLTILHRNTGSYTVYIMQAVPIATTPHLPAKQPGLPPNRLDRY